MIIFAAEWVDEGTTYKKASKMMQVIGRCYLDGLFTERTGGKNSSKSDERQKA